MGDQPLDRFIDIASLNGLDDGKVLGHDRFDMAGDAEALPPEPNRDEWL